MRTTIDLDEPVIRDLKALAARRNTTLRALVNELLRQSLAGRKPRTKYVFRWEVDRGGHLQPGVRLEDRDSLFDLMEGR